MHIFINFYQVVSYRQFLRIWKNYNLPSSIERGRKECDFGLDFYQGWGGWERRKGDGRGVACFYRVL